MPLVSADSDTCRSQCSGSFDKIDGPNGNPFHLFLDIKLGKPGALHPCLKALAHDPNSRLLEAHSKTAWLSIGDTRKRRQRAPI